MHDMDQMKLEAEGFEAEAIQGEAGEGESPLSENQEVQLASELLEVQSEEELDNFLGGLVSGAAKLAGAALRSDTGKALVGIAKDAAKKALPVIGRGIGSWISPERGGQLGASAGRWAGQALGLELEGLSHEDRDFEIAKQLVRFIASAARQAARVGPGPARAVAAKAATSAARQYAPGLVPKLQALTTAGPQRRSEPARETEWQGEDEGEEEGEEGEEEGESEAEVQLASELLELQSEEELDQFLGKLVKGVVKGAKSFIRSPVGSAVTGILKGVAKKALPIVGGAVGSFVAPGVGTAVGAKLGSMASNLFEVEAEGMPQGEAQYEVARRYVRLARASARNAAAMGPRGGNPRSLARDAVAKAARVHAPGVYRMMRRGPRGVHAPTYVNVEARSEDTFGDAPMSGRWVRRGDRIVLTGV